ncbi:MAG: hypothetical protein JWL81_313 [Verrucomicrobiales bacterium]|nr:hypothetical protein [Verrucomicrobiales bacterium]
MPDAHSQPPAPHPAPPADEPAEAAESASTGAGSGAFKPTRWTLVARAADPNAPESVRALNELCGIYWYPVYAWLRRSGRSMHDAQDLAQGFFCDILQTSFFSKARQESGRLRGFMLQALRWYVGHEWEKSTAKKRGGGAIMISIDAEAAEGRYRHEPVDDMTPDRLFQRRWALSLLEETVRTLGKEYANRQKEETFRVLKPFLGLGAQSSENTYATAAQQLNCDENAVRQAVFRLRNRYRVLLLQHVGETLDTTDEDQIRAELSELMEFV